MEEGFQAWGIQRPLCFEGYRPTNCPSRGAKSIRRESTGRGSVPWRLQHYIEPATILSEEKIRLVTHAVIREPSLGQECLDFFHPACATPALNSLRTFVGI
jgi:hypothetical protein